MLVRHVLRRVMHVRQVLRTTDLQETSSCAGWWYLAALVLRCTGGDRDVLISLHAGRWCHWAPWWRRQMAGLTRMMRISALKMGQRFDDDDGF